MFKIKVYEAMVDWIKHDINNRHEHLFEMIKRIRLPLISPDFLVEIISNEKMIKSDLKSRDLLDEAIYFHLLPEKRAQYRTFNLKPRCCNDSFGLIYAIGGLNSTGFLFYNNK